MSWKIVIGLCVVLTTVAARAADPPPQYKAWGRLAGPQAALPPGWKEVPPNIDDDRPPPGGISAQAKQRGFLLFSRNAMDLIYPGSFPREEDLTGEIRAFATLGEYEPMTFGLRALRALKSVTARIGDLSGPRGAVLPANQFDVRVVRCIRFKRDPNRKEYELRPLILEQPTSVDIPANTTQAFWITAHVPPDAKPGEYRGKLSIRAAGAPLSEIRVRIKVLPIRLKRTPQMYVIWASRAPLGNESLYLKVSRDQWDHGMNTSWPAWSGHVGKRDPANKTRLLPPDHVAPMRKGAERRADLWRRTEFARNPRPSLGSPDLHWIVEHWDHAKGWFTPWPLNDEIDTNVVNLVKMLEDVKKKKGLPEILYYLYDEAGGHPETFPNAVHYYKTVKEALPDLKTFTTIGGGLAIGIAEVDLLAPYVDIISTNRISQKIIRDIRGYKRALHIYNGGTMGRAAPTRDRLFFGFYAWKTTATGIGQWTYYWTGLRSSPFWSDTLGYAYLTPDGPVPSIHWEAIREGVDDMRYIVTLWELIQRAKKHRSKGVRNAASSAEQALAKIENMIPIPIEKTSGHALASGGLSPRVYDKWRWRAAKHIMLLHQKMRLGTGTGGEAQFAPREYNYTAADASPKLSRTNLLKGGDFESGMGPWAVQAWRGKGTGGRVTTGAHAGKASVRMSNSSGAMDTVVCVWYKPPIQLKAGHTYRFSAWIKPEGIVSGVTLRAKLPGTGDGPGTAGTGDWREVSYEIEPKKDGAPGYLAVWLQGAGRAWVDDLSLREVLVKRPRLQLMLGSDEFYTSDRFARVSVQIDPPGSGELSLSLRVRSSEGAAASYRKVVPVRGKQLRLRIPLARLMPGSHELVLELMGRGGRLLESTRLPFLYSTGPFSP